MPKLQDLSIWDHHELSEIDENLSPLCSTVAVCTSAAHLQDQDLAQQIGGSPASTNFICFLVPYSIIPQLIVSSWLHLRGLSNL